MSTDSSEHSAADAPSAGHIDVGDRVYHPSHQFGRIAARRNEILHILFDNGTAADIIASFAGLRKLGPWEEGRISPPIGELTDPTRFVPPLSRGERQLVAMLDRTLEPAWRLYVRPHLDAERPLLAAVHPELGGMIWDVVDWGAEQIDVRGATWVLRTEDGERRLRSPLDYLDEVRRKLYGVYLPDIGEQLNEDRRRFGLVRAGLYFENADSASVARWGGTSYTVFGRDAVESGDPGRVMPVFTRRADWKSEWFEAFDNVLGRVYRMPDALSAQAINAEQTRLSLPRPGFELLEGVAGSGKSVILAYRAAQIAQQGRRVLLLTYNRTLTNYLHGILRRVPVRHDPALVTVLHFHDLLSRVFGHHRLPKPTHPEASESLDPADADSRWLDEAWPEQALDALRTYGIPAQLRFDAILVDEGQDFGPTYVEVLNQLLSAATEPEVVVALDPAQRIYGRVAALLDGGPWKLKIATRRLRKGFRLAGSGARVANAFAQAWELPGNLIEARDDALLPGRFLWIAVAGEAEAGAAVVGLLDEWRAEPGFLAGRVAVLVSTVAMGEALVRFLWERGYSTNHVFPVRSQGALIEEGVTAGVEPEWRVSQARKTAFAFGDSRLKVSTIHSFKGWDADRVIFVLPRDSAKPSEQQIAKIYVGLTRAIEDTVVIGRGDGFGLAGLALESVEPTLDPAVVSRFEELHAHALAAGQRAP
jgi:hypothetical protein